MTDDRRMIHVRHDGVAHVELDTAFAYVADHRTVPEWMYGVTRFEPVGEQVRGVGAVFDACMRIGPAAFTSRLEIVEWEDNHRIVLSSISGFRTGPLGLGHVRVSHQAARHPRPRHGERRQHHPRRRNVRPARRPDRDHPRAAARALLGGQIR